MSTASTSPRPVFAALPGVHDVDGLLVAACPSCRRGVASMDSADVIECSAGCRHGQITRALFTAPRAAAAQPAGLVVRRASEIDVEQVAYLVPDRVPLGALTLLVGDPGLGKSTVTAEWAAGTTTGRYGEPATVLVANAEDSAAHVTVPRLAAAGADLERVEFFAFSDEHGERPVTLPDDVPAIEAHAIRAGARLVVIDPLNAHLSDQTSTHRDHSVRRALAPLAAMAEHGIAIVVVAHLNKAQGTDAIYRVGGSIGLVGAARSVLLLARDPDDPDGEDGDRRALAHAKSNWGKLAPTLVYQHEPATVTVRGRTVETHRLAEIGESEIDGRGLLGASHEDPPATKRERAVELLADVLADGEWHRMKEIEAAAGRADISRRVLYRAADEVGIERERRGFPAVAWWRLPVVPPAMARQAPTGPGHDSESPAITGNQGAPDPQVGTTPRERTSGEIEQENETRASLHMAPRCTCDHHLPTIDGDGDVRCLNCGRATAWTKAA